MYRVMRDHQLLLQRHTGKKPTRTHDGQVITLRSNTRWCSDSFEIRCWSGEVVRVVFSLDTCDRACMRYRAVINAGITGELVRDLMPESNGMAESFVKTLRRDYVYLSRLDSAANVIAQLPRWIDDYNDVHPHKGLKMRSPREYLAMQRAGGRA